MTMHSRLQYLKFMVTDEFYMLRERYLCHMDPVLRQITIKPYMPFIGVCVILDGYPDCIPPVLGYSLRHPTLMSNAYEQGKPLWRLFDSIFRLDYNYHINYKNPDDFFTVF